MAICFNFQNILRTPMFKTEQYAPPLHLFISRFRLSVPADIVCKQFLQVQMRQVIP